MSSFQARALYQLSVPAAIAAILWLAGAAGAQMQIGDVMTAGGFPAGTESKDDIARDQRAANNWNNAGQAQNELTVSQGGKLPDPVSTPAGSGGGGSGGTHESPLRSTKAYTNYPAGYYDMGSNHNDAVGVADGKQTYRGIQPHGSGGGGGDFAPGAPAALGSGNVYGSYAGNHYQNYGSTSQSPTVLSSASPGVSAGGAGQNGQGSSAADLPACCKAHLPCCGAKWPCCPSGTSNSSKASGAGNGAAGGAGGQQAIPATIPADQGMNSGPSDDSSNDPNAQTITTPPETEPLMGPPQSYGGLSAPMAANMRDLMAQAGLNGPQGGKMLGAAESGILGLAGAFQQLKAANMPGASAEQAKVNQNAEKGQTADNLAGMEREQAATAIDFVRSYLENFTTNSGNKWNRLRDSLFVPMAILLLLPGAVLAQVKSIVSQGFSVLGDVNPWDGIMRAIVGIFLIPATYLVMNYGIDVANSLTKTISDQYHNIFGTDMYEDAFSGHVRAFPIRLPEENYSVIPNIEATMFNYYGNSPLAKLEGKLLAVKYEDPVANIYDVPPDRAAETVPFLVNEARLMYNRINAGLAFAWTILCAVQQCYLYYLWFVGPVVAALWVYPMGQLRQALPNWVEGVISLCFWSFFWSTTILLMACFRGVDDTGTIVFTALNMLALGSVKFAFDFSGLVKDAGREAARLAEKASRLAASGGGKPSPSPGPGPNPKPGPNPDPDPDKIDPLNPLAQNALGTDSTGSPTMLASSSSTTATSNSLSPQGSSVSDAGLPPPMASFAAGQIFSPPVAYTEPPLSRGIQVASLDTPGSSAFSDSGSSKANFATDYPTQSWQQAAADLTQNQRVEGQKVDNIFAQQDQLAQREQQDRSYQEQQQQQRQSEEKRQQEQFVSAELKAAQMQQAQEAVHKEQQQQQEQRQQAQLQQQQQAYAAFEQQQAQQQTQQQQTMAEQTRLSQQQETQAQAQAQAYWQSQQGNAQVAGDLPPSSQPTSSQAQLAAQLNAGTTPPLTGGPSSNAELAYQLQSGSQQLSQQAAQMQALSGASGMAGAPGTQAVNGVDGLHAPVTPPSGVIPGSVQADGGSGSSAAAGAGYLSGTPVAYTGSDFSGPPLSTSYGPSGSYPAEGSATSYGPPGSYPAEGIASSYGPPGSYQADSSAAGQSLPGTGASYAPTGYGDSTAPATPVQPAAQQNLQDLPANQPQSSSIVSNTYTQEVPQNVLAPGGNNEIKHFWNGVTTYSNQVAAEPASAPGQGSSSAGLDSTGLRSLGQLMQQKAAENKPTSTDESPLNYVDLG
jgi:hypothetical protein